MSTNQTEDAISQGNRPKVDEVRTYKYYAGGKWRSATSGRTFDVSVGEMRDNTTFKNALAPACESGLY
jgi:hypothetical protein